VGKKGRKKKSSGKKIRFFLFHRGKKKKERISPASFCLGEGGKEKGERRAVLRFFFSMQKGEGGKEGPFAETAMKKEGRGYPRGKQTVSAGEKRGQTGAIAGEKKGAKNPRRRERFLESGKKEGERAEENLECLSGRKRALACGKRKKIRGRDRAKKGTSVAGKRREGNEGKNVWAVRKKKGDQQALNGRGEKKRPFTGGRRSVHKNWFRKRSMEESHFILRGKREEGKKKKGEGERRGGEEKKRAHLL